MNKQQYTEMQINDKNQLAQCHIPVISPSGLRVLSGKAVTILYVIWKYPPRMLCQK